MHINLNANFQFIVTFVYSSKRALNYDFFKHEQFELCIAPGSDSDSDSEFIHQITITTHTNII